LSCIQTGANFVPLSQNLLPKVDFYSQES
jgi:hypothetical protein